MLTFYDVHSDIIENINEFKDSMFWDEVRMDAPERIVHGIRRVDTDSVIASFITQNSSFRSWGY